MRRTYLFHETRAGNLESSPRRGTFRFEQLVACSLLMLVASGVVHLRGVDFTQPIEQGGALRIPLGIFDCFSQPLDASAHDIPGGHCLVVLLSCSFAVLIVLHVPPILAYTVKDALPFAHIVQQLVPIVPFYHIKPQAMSWVTDTVAVCRGLEPSLFAYKAVPGLLYMFCEIASLALSWSLTRSAARRVPPTSYSGRLDPRCTLAPWQGKRLARRD
ncbi:hypothetical protein VTI28DRAFT_7731 [Corynascus sepedonium]